jgi:hypothetical protein
MATQYTAGIVQGQKWTAAIANQIGAAWETWTPTITASAGAFTTTTVNVARYCQLQKIVIGVISVSIGNVGTATGQLRFTVPITFNNQPATGGNGIAGNWNEILVSGENGFVGMFSTTTAALYRYDGAAYLGTGDRYTAYFVYEGV